MLYTLIIITLKRQKTTATLSGSFFRIVEMQFYADAVFFIEFTITMRFRKYSGLYSLFTPSTELHGVIPRIVSGVHYYIKIVVYIGYLTFAVNRISSAINISSYNNVNLSSWNPKVLRRITIFKWLLPLIFVLPTHCCPCYSYWLVVTTSSIRLMNDEASTALVAYIDGSCCLFTCLFCLICYMITGFLIRKNWNRIRKDSAFKKNVAQNAAERSLFISAILSFFVLTLNTFVQVWTIVISISGTDQLLFVQDLSYPMIDLMYSHFPWTLLLTSSVLRKQMIYDTKMFLRSAFKLDDASVGAVRVGQTISPATKLTSNRISLK